MMAVAAGAAPARSRPAAGVAGADAGPGLRPDGSGDHSELIRRALAGAADAGGALRLAAGTFRVRELSLSAGARLVGAGSSTQLLRIGRGPLLAGRGGQEIVLEQMTVQGEPGAATPEPLIHLADIARLRLRDIGVHGAGGQALRLERCGGVVEACRVTNAGTGLFALDSSGLRIIGNEIADCADNGIQVWRSAKGFDGTQVTGNRLARIAARSGGSGQNGNAINIFRAGGVTVSGNTIRGCAFTAVRNNAGDDVQILGNSCTDLGETAIYAEFGFEGCVIANNLVDGAGSGILITNFDSGGRLSACQGNVVRNLRRGPNVETGRPDYGVGIAAEADTALTGNVVENADHAGFSLGYGPFLRDVVCANNVVRGATYGAAVSVAPKSGLVQVTGNLFARCRAGALVGFEWDKPVSADLLEAGPGGGRFRNLVHAGNMRGDPAPG
jgi:uncharacterized secreted repeat protein (TIGR03808 family)